MDQAAITFQHCADMVALLNRSEGWGLSDEEQIGLADVATRYLPEKVCDEQIRKLIINVHHDHAIVTILRDDHGAISQDAWARWLEQARAILRHAHLDWSRDEAIHLEDLAQVALLALLRALPSFSYKSRFSTWAYQVITQAAQRHLRDLSAKKRSGEIDGQVDPSGLALAVGDSDLPEVQANARLLLRTIEAELTPALGVRNTTVFRLWAYDDLSAEMIGRRVGLSVARVYAVIAQARHYLTGCETIRHWAELPTM